jgi:hypothetical protein
MPKGNAAHEAKRRVRLLPCFKDPLLAVLYTYDAGGRLRLIELSAMRSIKRSGPLASWRFEIPPRTRVIDLGKP